MDYFYDAVNTHQMQLGELAHERPCIAPWVAIRFVVDRELHLAMGFVDPGIKMSQWRNSTREARGAALEDEIFRERRGDYAVGP